MLNSDRNFNFQPYRLDRSSIDSPSKRIDRGLTAIPICREATTQAILLTDAPVAILTTVAEVGCEISSIAGLEKFHKLANCDNLSEELAGIEYCHDRALAGDRGFIVSNYREHAELVNSSLCQLHGIKAYLGLPIITAAGDRLGTLSILDFIPRHFTDRDRDLLHLISRLVASELERSYLSQSQVNRWMGELKSQPIRGYDDPLAATETNYLQSEHSSSSLNLPLFSTGFNKYPQPFQPASNSHRQGAYPPVAGEISFRLLANLAQELRTPLTAILGMARVLQQEIYGSLCVKQKEYLSIIHNSGLQLGNIIDEIAQLGAFDRQQNQLTLKSVDLEMLCQLTRHSLEPLTEQKQQKITIHISSSHSSTSIIRDRLWVLDKEKVKQIIYYLSLSLIQSSGKHHEIAIQMSNLTDRLQIQITTSDRHAILLPLDSSDDSIDPTFTHPSHTFAPILNSGLEFHRSSGREIGTATLTPQPQPIDISQDLRIRLGLSLSQTLAAIHGATIGIAPNRSGYQLTLPLILTERGSRGSEN